MSVTPQDLRQLRELQGFTIYDMAVATGLSHCSISRLETGKQGFSIDSARSVAKAYGVDINDLIGDPAEK